MFGAYHLATFFLIAGLLEEINIINENVKDKIKFLNT